MSKGKPEYRLSQMHKWSLNLIFNELKPRTHKVLKKSAKTIWKTTWTACNSTPDNCFLAFNCLCISPRTKSNCPFHLRSSLYLLSSAIFLKWIISFLSVTTEPTISYNLYYTIKMILSNTNYCNHQTDILEIRSPLLWDSFLLHSSSIFYFNFHFTYQLQIQFRENSYTLIII